MLNELIEFVDSILPSVPMEKKEGLLEAIEQFEKTGEQVNYLMLNPLSELSQGDIISSVPFCYFDDDGSLKQFNFEAMVLSTSCHIDQKDKIILAPIFPLNSFDGNTGELKKNRIFDFMYIPDVSLSDKYIDFEILGTYSKSMLETALCNGRIQRKASLNQMGYYLLLIKLTVYLMRREDSKTLEERNVGSTY